jgi:hypothetical protein
MSSSMPSSSPPRTTLWDPTEFRRPLEVIQRKHTQIVDAETERILKKIRLEDRHFEKGDFSDLLEDIASPSGLEVGGYEFPDESDE